MKNIVYNEKLYVRPNVVMIVLCPTKFKLCLTKIGIWSDVCPVKKKYLFAAMHICILKCLYHIYNTVFGTL